MEDIYKKMNIKLLGEFQNLYEGNAVGLPSWDLIYNVAALAKREPTHANISFATMIYYVLEDLFKPVKYTWAEYSEINSENKTVTIIKHTHSCDSFGKDIPEKITTDYSNDIHWKLYEGKNIDELNKDIKSYPVIKYYNYINNEKDNIPYSYINFKKVEENYKTTFKNVIDPYAPNIDFNRFAELMGFVSESNSTQDLSINKTKTFIEEELETIDKNLGWGYAFNSEEDYNNFVALLVNFFESKPYSLPSTNIKLRKGCKTRLGPILGNIYKGATENNNLSKDFKFIEIIKKLNWFASEGNNQICKALTRR